MQTKVHAIGDDGPARAKTRTGIETVFSRAAVVAAKHAGRAHSFFMALVVVVVWAATGPVFGYSDTWQLLINTGTTIATFLMIFLLQNTQNRDTSAIQLKLDELIAANKSASNALLKLEDLTEDELEFMRDQYRNLGRRPGPPPAPEKQR